MDEAPGWYALALGADLDPGTASGTRLFGHELVVWRDGSGAAHAWEDRCPHRGMRLSFGFVRGDHIACLYHGWQYDAAGQCRHIPAHPDLAVSPMIRARTYPTQERRGLVWIRWGDADASGPPDDGAATPLRSLYLDAPGSRVLGAFGPVRDGLARCTLGGLPVLAAVQPLSADRSAAHVLMDGPPDAFSRADRMQAARAALDLRRAVESRAAA